ncbi:hypothetical protein F9K81_04870 [Brucella anthropi]|uniref:hypothetical protein n=1 Tax=Brucella anthropi TaxID=529 RepID=UPI00124D66E4|nr:hypothetical protein [Brucella anthropi]KAB2760772.1 hypothetical protein F9K81_04870 [Brucella anthropi]
MSACELAPIQHKARRSDSHGYEVLRGRPNYRIDLMSPRVTFEAIDTEAKVAGCSGRGRERNRRRVQARSGLDRRLSMETALGNRTEASMQAVRIQTEVAYDGDSRKG